MAKSADPGEERRPLLEAIAPRVPTSPWRSKIRRFFFPSSHYQLMVIENPAHAHDHPPRGDWFEWLSLFMILVNSIILAISAPLQSNSSPRNQVSNIVDNILTVFFMCETGLRITSFGTVLFSHDTWFVVDTVVVAGSAVAFVGSFFASGKGGFSLSGLRSFRLMKPIRSLRAISAARVIIGSILASMAGLRDVITLTIMVMLLLGVGGVSQYNSRLVNRCISSDYYNSPVAAQFFPAANFSKQDFVRYGAYEVQLFNALGPVYNWATRGQLVGGRWVWDSTLANVSMLFDEGPNPLAAFLFNDSLFDSVRLPCPGKAVNVSHLPSSVARFYVNCSQVLNSVTSNATSPRGAALFQLVLEAYQSPWTSTEFASRWKEFQNLPSWQTSTWQSQACNKVNALLLTGYRCPENYVCDDVQNPIGGILGFDNLPQALLSVFIFSTFQQWFYISGMMADAVDVTSQIFFFMIVLFLGLFVMNLIVAQITSSFEIAYAKEKEDLAAERRRTLTMTGSPASQRDGQGPTSTIAEFAKRKYATMSDWFAQRVEKDRIAFDDNDSDDEDDKRALDLRLAQQEQAAVLQKAIAAAQAPQPVAESTVAASSARPVEMSKTVTVLESRQKVAAGSTERSLAAVMREARRLDQLSVQTEVIDAERQRKREEAERNRIKSVADVRLFIMKAMNSKPGLIFITAVILLNVVSLAMDYYPESPEYEAALNRAALFFDIFFTLEVITRWFAYGFFGYMRHFTNWIDLVVVLLSWLDVMLTSFNAPIIRALRLLRLYAVFKAFDELRLWLMVIRHALMASLILAVVILCAVFIVACLGMQLLGGLLCDQPNDARPDNTDPSCLNRPRSNFDDIGTALITSFQIMTGDNWDNVLYTGYAGYSPWTSFFFIGWYVVSNVILVNLVIAIVLEARAEVMERETARAVERELLERTRRENDPAYHRWLEEEQERQHRRQVLTGKPLDAILQAHGVLGDDEPPNECMADMLRSTFVRRSILAVTFVGTLLMAFESPFDAPNANVATILRNCDIAVSAFFLAELALKITVYGFWKSPHSYLKQSSWHWVDIFVILSGFAASLCLYWTQIHMTSRAERLVNIFRALRPLRFVCVSQTLRDVLGVLALAVAPLRHLGVVIVLMFTFWGILGVQLFKGSFYTCSDPQYTNKTACLNASDTNSWVLSESHFNHLPAAYTTLFTVISLDGWTSIMWDGIDAVGEDQAFVVGYNPWAALYFVSFVVVGNFFFLNLFVSVLIEGYDRAKGTKRPAGAKASPFLTPSQNAWIRSHHVVLSLVPQVDYDDDENKEHTSFAKWVVIVRRHVRKFVRHPLFDVVVYCFIVVNFAVMAADRYPKSDSMSLVITFANTGFTCIFAIELLLRIVADTPTRFFFYKWNQFDTVIVVVSLVSLVLEYLLSSTTFASFFRTLRALRLLRLLRKTRRLQIVLKRFVLTLASLVNIATLIALLFVIFGLMGMKLFGRVAYNGDVGLHSNFEDPINALSMLMRMCTSGSWTPVMVQLASTADDGTCNPDIDTCGLNVISQIYFVIFISIGSFVVLNLFVAVVLDTFTEGQEGDFGYLTEWEGGQLLQLWLRFDPDFTYRMESRFFVSFMRSIPKESVLGVFANLPAKQRFRHELVALSSMQLSEYGGVVELQDVIYALCRRAYAFQKRKWDAEADEWNGVERESVTAEQLERRWRPIELGILESRRLDRKAQVWFRRDARDAQRPVGAEYDVTMRFAVMILEQYWIQREKTRRRNAFFRQRREQYLELLRLSHVVDLAQPTLQVSTTRKAPSVEQTSNGTAAEPPQDALPSATAAPVDSKTDRRADLGTNKSTAPSPSLRDLVAAHKAATEAPERADRLKARRVVATQAQLLAQQVVKAHTARERIEVARRHGAPLSYEDILQMGDAFHQNQLLAEEARRLRADDVEHPVAATATRQEEGVAANAKGNEDDDDDDAEFYKLL